MKMRPLRLVAGAGALAAGTAAGSAAFAVPDAAAQTLNPAAPAPAPLTLTDVAGPDLYGAPTTFTLTVTNPSKKEAVHQADVTDILPVGVTYVTPPPPVSDAPSTAAGGTAPASALHAATISTPSAPPAGATTGTGGSAAATSTAGPAAQAATAPPAASASQVSPAAPPPPVPTVTVNPDGTTTLGWSGLADIAPGGHLTLTFSAQPAVAPAAGAYLPGSTFSDSATVQSGADQQQTATAAAKVAVTTATISQSATPLPSKTKTGTVMDTIRLDGAPLADSTGVEVDLYLPGSVKLGSCPAPPAPSTISPVSPAPSTSSSATPVPAGASTPAASKPAVPPPPPCTLPTSSTPQKTAADADGTPAWPLATGKTGFVDLQWIPGSLAANSHQSFTVPLQVTNPADWTGVSPAVLAVLTASQVTEEGPAAMAPVTNKQVMGTTPPPPAPPKTTPVPTTPAVTTAAPSAVPTGAASVAAVEPAATVTPGAAVPAGSRTAVHDAVVETGPTVKPTTTTASPFAVRSSTLAAGAPSGPATAQSAPATAGRDPFLAPGQVDTPSTPATPTVQTPVSGVPALGIQTTATPSSTKSSNLAYTGIDAEGLGWLAGGLLTAGVGLVLAARRRPAKAAPSGA